MDNGGGNFLTNVHKMKQNKKKMKKKKLGLTNLKSEPDTWTVRC
ncbi:unnamed protein product [Arabidopsis halleri]